MARSRKTPAGPEKKGTRKVKGIIFGPPGHGKTHFIGTAVFDARTCPIFILDFEGGVEDVLEGLPGGPDGPDWYYIPVRSWDDFNDAFERVEKNEEGCEAVAIDSLSETHIFALMHLLEDPTIRRDDDSMLRQDDYGKAMIQLRRLTRSFRDLPLHVFYTAHSKDEVVSKEGLVKMVSLSGKLATEIPGMMTVVGYLALDEDEEGKTQRVLLLQNYAKIRTKIRTPWGVEAPDEIYDPTLKDLMDALNY